VHRPTLEVRVLRFLGTTLGFLAALGAVLGFLAAGVQRYKLHLKAKL
jgi:hypothetical protein